MKKLFVISLLFWTNFLLAQSATVYTWEEVRDTQSPDTIRGITFSKLKLDSLPTELARFTNLEYLDISKNHLTSAPQYLSSFANLIYFNAEKNKLENFPVFLCSLKKVEEVILGRNQIETIPNCIGDIQSLVKLDLYENPIRALPDRLMDLKNLKKLDLSGIRFSPTFQNKWIERLPNTEIEFDPPCDCMK